MKLRTMNRIEFIPELIVSFAFAGGSFYIGGYIEDKEENGAVWWLPLITFILLYTIDLFITLTYPPHIFLYVTMIYYQVKII